MSRANMGLTLVARVGWYDSLAAKASKAGCIRVELDKKGATVKDVTDAMADRDCHVKTLKPTDDGRQVIAIAKNVETTS